MDIIESYPLQTRLKSLTHVDKIICVLCNSQGQSQLLCIRLYIVYDLYTGSKLKDPIDYKILSFTITKSLYYYRTILSL